MIEYEISEKVTFPVYIDCVYQQGRYDEHVVARQRRSSDAPFIETPCDAREHYRKRFGIESFYRLAKQNLVFTSSRDAGFRLLLFVVSLLLQNVWHYPNWMYVAAPHRGGRRLLEWSFVEFCHILLCAAWTALGVRQAVPANQSSDSRFFR